MNDGAHDGAALVAERREVREAIQAIGDAMMRINEALRRLGNADKLAQADIWGGGLFVSLWKRDEVKQASVVMRGIDVALEKVREELRDLGVDDAVGAGAGRGPTVRTLDVWFDNLVSDLVTRRKIKSSTERLRRLGEVLTRVQSNLNRRERALSERIDAVQA
jgi:hypothetical protein